MKIKSNIASSSPFSEGTRPNLSPIKQLDRYKALFSLVVWPYLKSKVDQQHVIMSQSLEPENVPFLFVVE
jgi:hypothetical protein